MVWIVQSVELVWIVAECRAAVPHVALAQQGLPVICGSRASVLPYGLIPLAQIVALTLASVAGAPDSADLRWS